MTRPTYRSTDRRPGFVLDVVALTLVALFFTIALLASPAFGQPLGDDGFDRAERRAQQAGAMLVRGADADRDGTVTAAEWDAQLAALDADSDGVVSDDEAKAFREARREARQEAREAEGFKARGPRGFKARGGGGDGESRFARAFDADGDGTVTATELEQVYLGFDADGDGAVLVEELPTVRRPGHRAHHRRAHQRARGAMLLRVADADDDGTLSRDEWTTFLATADTDGDGSIDGDEMRAVVEANRPGDREPRSVEIETLEGLFDRVDADGDGTITTDELPGPRRHRGGFGGDA